MVEGMGDRMFALRPFRLINGDMTTSDRDLEPATDSQNDFRLLGVAGRSTDLILPVTVEQKLLG